ncbi:hypothetical protein CAPTEDRAFT_185395 [Capitella teleta]|uniref:Uncharacterized protein n=1 Tax=Capitella teleta TaxID=283909 RepID=R7TAV8_CAPTE|nr:hypothetical protein CAPTEDRAFT_185395 [Capitella teleta]|eukprot:ELT90824.1 hypothetical protein CAPTEDRAFT_185395 [Capitella teleta]
MADVSFSAGSDEECEILVGMVHDRLPREYAHQPIRIVESETSDENHSTTASEEESTAEEATENRLASVNTWCRCGMCESETLGDEKEAICCLEVPNCVKMIAAARLVWLCTDCYLMNKIKRRLKSSPNGRPSTKDDGNQGEKNAPHVYDKIPDDRMTANSGEASHQYENVNARTHNEPPQNMVAGIQANGQTANARSQHNDRHYVNMETARNLNEQQSDQLNRQVSSPARPQRQESKQGDAGGANVYEGLADVPEEIPNAYESIDVRTTHE